MKRVLILSLAMIAAALPLAAQNTGGEDFRGFNAYNAYNLGSFDAVNLDNGNLTLTIPIVSYPQKGSLPNFTLDLHYVGQSWYMPCYNNGYGEYCDWLPASTAQTGPVVSFDPQYGTGYRTCSRAACGYPCPCSNDFITDVDGGIHNVGNGANNEALDGTGLYYSSSGTVIDKDGIWYCPNCYPTAEQDASGNTITHNATTYTDSVGRTIPDIAYDMPISEGHYQPGCTSEYFPVVSGGTAPIKICVSTISYSSDLPSDGYPNVANYSGSIGMITSITLPNDTTWNFSYDSWGELSQVTTPTGGTVSYAWENMPVPYFEAYVQEDAYYRGVATRITNANDGTGNKTWTYSATLGGTSYPGMTDPDGNMTVFSNCLDALNAGCVYGTHKYYTPSGGLLKTTQTGYEAGEYALDVYDPTPSMAYILPNSTSTIWPNGLENYVATTYDSAGTYTDSYCTQDGNPCGPWPFPYGSVLEKQEYDYSTSAQPQSSALLRQTSTQYEWQSSSSFLNANLLSQPASVTVQDGSSNTAAETTYAYDESGRASSCSTAPCGLLTTTNRYVSSSTELTSHTNYNSSNSKGMPTDTFDANGNHTCITYDSTVAYAYPSEIQHPTPSSGGTCSSTLFELFSYDLNTGLLIHHWDENNQETSYSYDSMQRPTSVSYPDGGSESFAYTDSTPPYFNYTKAITSGANFAEQGNADGFGRQVRTITTVPSSTCSGGYSYVDTTYDNEGRTFSVSNPYCTTSDTTYGVTKTYYDVLNRVTSMVEQDNGTVTTVYTGNSSTTPPTYCATVSDEAGKSRESCADGLGRMTHVWEDPGGLNYETDYGYDTLDNLKTVVQSSSRTRTFTYDWLSRLLSASNPESGTTCYGTYSGSTCQQNGYDGDGNLIYKTDARGILTTNSYDALNRVTSKNYSDGTAAATFLYDVSSASGVTIQNPKGRLVMANTSASSSDFSYIMRSYDPMGRVLIQWQWLPARAAESVYAFAVSAGYNLMGLPTYYTNETNAFYPQYDAAGRPTGLTSSLSDSNHPGTLASGITYTPPGGVAQISYANGLTAASFYNNRLQPCRINVNSSSSALSACTGSAPSGNVEDFQYGFNSGTSNNGNVTSWNGSGNQAFTRSYSTDSLNRISGLSDSTSGNPCPGLSWSYDNWGNLTAQTITSGSCGSLSLSYNTSNQITNTGIYYDAAGNMTNDGSHSYTYDAENRLTAVDGGSTASYVYDAEGRRVQKNTSGGSTAYVYDIVTDRVVEETNGSDTMQVGYAYLGGQLLSEYASGTTYFVHQDHLGSTRLVTGLSGCVADSLDYLPYGELNPVGGTSCASANPTHKFTGKERDPETGLNHFVARYDSSQFGSFMSPDPGNAGADPTKPQSWNMYSYVLNNPVNLIDPTGMDDENPTCGTACADPNCGMFCGIVGPGLNPGYNCPEGTGCYPIEINDSPVEASTVDPPAAEGEPQSTSWTWGCETAGVPCGMQFPIAGNCTFGIYCGGIIMNATDNGTYSNPDPIYTLDGFSFQFLVFGYPELETVSGVQPPIKLTPMTPRSPTWKGFFGEFLPCFGAQLLWNTFGTEENAGATVTLNGLAYGTGDPLAVAAAVLWDAQAELRAGMTCSALTR